MSAHSHCGPVTVQVSFLRVIYSALTFNPIRLILPTHSMNMLAFYFSGVTPMGTPCIFWVFEAHVSHNHYSGWSWKHD